MRCCGKRGREVGLEEKQKFAGLDRLEKAFSVGGITLGAKAAAAAKSLQSCPTLCDPRDSSPPGSPSLGFSRQEYWSGLSFPSPRHESEK